MTCVTVRTGIVIAAAFAGLTGLVRADDRPATRPARDLNAIGHDLNDVGRQLRKVLADDIVTDAAKRSTAAATAIPLIHRQIGLVDEAATSPLVPPQQQVAIKGQLASSKTRSEAMLYLFGDKLTVARIDAAAGDDLHAKAVQMLSKWMAAGHDADAQQAIAAQVQKLDAGHTDDEGLTVMTANMATTAVSPTTKQQLLDTATKTMVNPTAKGYAMMAAQMRVAEQAAAKQKDMVGKPLTIEATTVDGKPFTSADYKGKVVLVDFWATWCGPCVAELPRVRDLYAKYHDKGLEVIGVDNDYGADAVKSYTGKNGMPWVELFDAAAADNHQWNPTTLGYGINGIPTMFLIDKKGVCRTVEAREQMEELVPKLLAE